MNVQQVALGYRSLYIRLEEAFIGPHGTFTFLTGNTGKTDLFLDSLKLAYRRAVPDLDQYEDPHVVVNTETEQRLRQLLAREESVDERQVELLVYMLVNVCDNKSKGGKTFSSKVLVVTARCLYIIKEDFIYYPQTTFSVGPSSHPQFQVVSQYPVECKICDFQMYDSDSFNKDQMHSLTSAFSATNTSAMLSPNFIGYGTKLTFDIGGGNTKELDVRVSTPNVRNKFLEALTSARSKFMDKSPTKVRFKVKSGEKESDSVESSSDEKRKQKLKSKRDRKKGSIKSKSKVGQRSVQGETTQQEISKAYALSKTDFTIDEGSELSEGMYDLGNLKRESPAGESADNSELVDKRAAKSVTSSAEDFLNYTGSMSSDLEEEDELKDLNSTQLKRPQSLMLGYPSMELLDHLTSCNQAVPMFGYLSEPLKDLAVTTGEEILNYFHSKVAQIGMEGEELQHLLWTEMVPYINPKQTVLTCLFLTNKALYFLSTDLPQKPVEKAPWRKHVRYRSDTSHFLQNRVRQSLVDQSLHTMSGIVHKSSDRQQVKVYCTLPLRELRMVHVGLFDQSFRLMGSKAEELHCAITRDSGVTETFMRHLMTALTMLPTPSPQKPLDLAGSGSEQDFYRMFRDRTLSRAESLEYVHPSRVRFVYPNDEVVDDLRYVIRESIRGVKPSEINTNILSYLVVYKQHQDCVSDTSGSSSLSSSSLRETRTVVLTEDHLTVVSEDYVSYPLPDFAKQPPLHKQHVILEVRRIQYLKRVVGNDLRSPDLTLVFSDESEEISVDAALEYYSPKTGRVDENGMESPEVSWTLIVQNLKDKERFLKLVTRQWEETHNATLSVQVNA